MPRPLQIAVDSRVRVRGDFPPEVRRELKSEFDHSNQDFFKKRNIGKAVYGVPRRIQTYAEERGEISFPRGGFSRVREILRTFGFAYEVSDDRVLGERVDLTYSNPDGEPAEHQYEAVEALTAKQNALLRITTGGRKTSIGMMLAAELGVTSLFLVDTTQLFGQWRERVVRELGVREGDVGLIGDGSIQLRPITVGMIPTLASRFKRSEEDTKKVASYFGMVVVDEVQIAAAERTGFVVDRMPAKYRFGLSDDERRSDGKEFLTYDLFGKVAYTADRERLIRDGVIVDVEVRVIPTDFEAPWYGTPTGEDWEREVDFDRLLKQMAPDAARNKLGVDAVLAEIRSGAQVLVMTERREHCQILSSLLAGEGSLPGNLIGGDDMRAEFRQSVARIKSGELRVGVGTIKAIGKALDLPKVSVGLIASPLASSPYKFRQGWGRFCRASKSTGKTHGVLYYLWDRKIYPVHLRNLVAWNKTVRVLDRVSGEYVSAESYLSGTRPAQLGLTT